MFFHDAFYKKEKEIRSIKNEIISIKKTKYGGILKKLAVEHGVGEVTVGDWRRNRNKLEVFFSNKCSGVSLDSESLKKSEYEKTGEAIFVWFIQQRQK